LKLENVVYLEPILKDKGFETKIVRANYEFQNGANEFLSIKEKS
jgi:hypothetical protein